MTDTGRAELMAARSASAMQTGHRLGPSLARTSPPSPLPPPQLLQLLEPTTTTHH
jgi:hypothetical protein